MDGIQDPLIGESAVGGGHESGDPLTVLRRDLLIVFAGMANSLLSACNAPIRRFSRSGPAGDQLLLVPPHQAWLPRVVLPHNLSGPKESRTPPALPGRLRVDRPEDHLHLEFEFVNLRLGVRRNRQHIFKRFRNAPAFVIVSFPAQHVAEESFYLPPGQELPPRQLPIRSRLGQPARLAFEFPDELGERGLPFRLQDLLRWSELRLRVRANAARRPVGNPTPGEPGPRETSIPVPHGLILSPPEDAEWHHAEHPVRNQGRSEVWHTRLHFQAGMAPIVRAIHHVGGTFFPRDGATGPDTYLPNACHRRDIQDLSSHFDLPLSDGSGRYVPRPITVQALHLSSPGALAKLHGAWDPSEPEGGYRVDEWNQDDTGGRDQMVLVSEKGYGLPFGHYISFITRVERELHPALSSFGRGKAAILRKRYYCKVRVPTLLFPLDPTQRELKGRCFPFRKVSIAPETTPFLREPVDLESGTVASNPSAFWMVPEGRTEPFEFTVTAEDHEGERVEFALPLLWVSRVHAEAAPGGPADPCTTDVEGPGPRPPSSLRGILEAYCAAPGWRTSDLGLQRVAMVPPGGGSQRTRRTSFQTASMTFRVEAEPGVEPDERECRVASSPQEWQRYPFPPGWGLRFYPALQRSRVRMEEALTLAPASGDQTTALQYARAYLASGFDKRTGENAAEVFAEVVDGRGPNLAFRGARTGGAVAPSIRIAGFSRMTGPVGGGGAHPQSALLATSGGSLDAYARGSFDPSAFFGTLGKLLGAVDLSQVVEPISALVEKLERVPRMVVKHLEQFRAVHEEIQLRVDQVRSLLDLSLEDVIEQAVSELEEHVREQLDTLWSYWGSNALSRVEEVLELSELKTAGGEIRGLKRKVELQRRWWFARLQDGRITEEARHEAEARAQAWLRGELRRLGIGEIRTALTSVEKRADAVTEGAIRSFAQEVQETLRDARKELNENQLEEWQQAYDAWERMFRRMSVRCLEQIDSRLSVAREAAIVLDRLPLQRTKAALARLADVPFDDPWQLRDQLELLADIVDEVAATLRSDIRAAYVSVTDQARGRAGEILNEVRDRAENGIARLESDLSEWIRDYGQLLRNHQSIGDLERNARLCRNNFEARLDVALSQLFERTTQALQAIPAVELDEVARQASVLLGAYDRARGELESIMKWAEALEERIPKEVRLEYAWEPTLRDAPGFQASSLGEAAKLALSIRVRKSVDLAGGLQRPPEIEIDGRLSNFEIYLIPSQRFVTVAFESLSFRSNGSGAPQVAARISDVRFSDVLDFVAQFATALSRPGYQIRVAPIGVLAEFGFELPNLTSGAFNLLQLSVHSSLVLPFDGTEALARFALSTRSKPFLLTVGILGGGGFFALSVSPKGVRKLEGALEFGATVVLSLGPAHGSAYVRGGVYFSVAREVSVLSGFVRAGGSLRFLGLINVSVEFYLALSYVRTGDESYAEGLASLAIVVEIGPFFTVRVTVVLRKRFAGSRSSSRVSKERVAFAADTSSTATEELDPVPVGPDPERFRMTNREWRREREYDAW